MPAIVRWSRRTVCRGRGALRSSRSCAGEPRVWPRLGAELGERLVGLQLARPQRLHPCGLLGAELPQPQLPPVAQAHEQSRGSVPRARTGLEQLQAPGRHQMDQQHEGL